MDRALGGSRDGVRNKWEARLSRPTRSAAAFFSHLHSPSAPTSRVGLSGLTCPKVACTLSRFLLSTERAAFAAPRVRPSHSRARSSGIVPGEYLVALLISDCPARRSTRTDAKLSKTWRSLVPQCGNFGSYERFVPACSTRGAFWLLRTSRAVSTPS